MIRNLKVLFAAAMALAAFGAISATAHAAEESFHCSVAPCTLTLAPDEVAGTTTAHHVFVLKGETHAGVKGASVSTTCDQLTGEATVETKTVFEATFKNLKYENKLGEHKCKIGAAETVTIDFTGCDYKFTSLGGGTDNAEVHMECPTGKAIDINVNNIPCLSVTPFTAKHIGYRDSGLNGGKHIITATVNVSVPAAAVHITNTENVNCKVLGLRKIESATYMTGNTLVKAETHPGGVTASTWWE